jgi:hypothetical protein
MPESREHVLGKLAWDAVPAGLSIGIFFGGNAMATGSFLIAAETTGFFIGVGAIGAGLAMAVAPALIIAAIAVAVGDDKTVAEVSRAADELSPFLSPGTLGLVPISPFITPSDPMLFARAVGPGIDLLTGALSPSKLDNFQSYLQSLAGLSAWRSDAVNLGTYSLSSQFSSIPALGQYPNGGYPTYPSSSPHSPVSDSSPSSNGYPYDNSFPGDGEFFGGSSAPTSNSSTYIEGYTEAIEGGSSNEIESGAGPAPGSGDNDDSSEGGTEGNGSPNEGDGQPDQGGGTSEGGSDGESNGGDGAGDDGSDDGGGEDGGGED